MSFAEHWRQDLTAGLTTAVMLVPQGMAYALLAGLPPIVGLYAATLPLLVYAALGTSRQLALGPMALSSLLVATGIAQLGGAAELGADEYLGLAVLITLVVGMWQTLLGALRLGGLVNLLSHPVVSGFTAAAAFIIGASQLKHLLGFDVPGDGTVIQTVVHIGAHISETHLLTLIVGVAAIGTLVGIKCWFPRWPAALVAVVVGILSSYLFDFAALGVETLGDVPSGLPMPKVPEGLSLASVQQVAPLGLTIALIAYMESISAAKVYARSNRYSLSPSRELVAQGLANVASSFCGGYVVGGALSRTAVNAEAGAKSTFAGVITAVMVSLVLLMLTAPFAYLPKPILASMILVAVTSLIDVAEFKHLWVMKRDDLVILVITLIATLLFSAVIGLLTGVASSLIWLIITTTRPNIAVLGRLPNQTSYRCIDHFEDLETFERVIIMRMDAQFFFGNVAYLKDAIYRQVAENPDTVALVLDASSINALDSTAVDTYEEIVLDLRNRGIEVMISHVKGPVLRVLQIAGLVDTLGEGHIFYEVQDAVSAALRHRDAVEQGVSLAEEDFGLSDMID